METLPSASASVFLCVRASLLCNFKSLYLYFQVFIPVFSSIYISLCNSRDLQLPLASSSDRLLSRSFAPISFSLFLSLRSPSPCSSRSDLLLRILSLLLRSNLLLSLAPLAQISSLASSPCSFARISSLCSSRFNLLLALAYIETWSYRSKHLKLQI